VTDVDTERHLPKDLVFRGEAEVERRFAARRFAEPVFPGVPQLELK
jgi:hypothetical protein